MVVEDLGRCAAVRAILGALLDLGVNRHKGDCAGELTFFCFAYRVAMEGFFLRRLVMSKEARIILVGLGVVAVLMFVFFLLGCTPSSVTGVVKDVEERYSFFNNGNVGGTERFLGITIVEVDGTEHRAALSVEHKQTHGIRPGNVLTVKLGRTAYRSTIGEHAVKEKDGTVRMVESQEVGWRLIEEYKIVQSAQK